MQTIERVLSVPPAQHSPPLKLRTIGAVEIYWQDQPIPINSRKALALLAYLRAREGGVESRERLAGLLWGDSSEEKARGSLRQCLTEIRSYAPLSDLPLIKADRLDVRLIHALVSYDVDDALLNIGVGRLAERLADAPYWASDYLVGFDDLDQSFHTWISIQRQALHGRLIRKLEDALNTQLDLQSRKDCALALVRQDPTNEFGCQQAMRALAEDGDAIAAQRIYQQLWKLLEDEFDAEPNRETQELVAAIKLGKIAPRLPNTAVVRSATTAPAIREFATPVLVVGLLDQSLTQGEFGAVATIFRSEMIAALARFRDWQIFEPTPARQFDELLNYRVELSPYSVELQLIMLIVLRDHATGRFIWSERFELSRHDWFTILRTIIRRIAIAIEVNISSERLASLTGNSVLPSALFDKWLKGQELIFRWSPSDEDQAEQLFRSLNDEAPSFAPAYSAIAGILNARHLIFPGVIRDAVREQEALSLCLKATSLDPLDSRAQLHLAWSLALNGDYQKASVTFALAHQLNENDPWTIVSAGEGLALCGDVRAARDLVMIAESVGFDFSLLHRAYQVSLFFLTGDFERSAAAYDESQPLLNCCGGWAAAANFVVGRREIARTAARLFCERSKSNWYGEMLPTDEAITRWFLTAFPIASKDARSLLESSFLGALRTKLTQS